MNEEKYFPPSEQKGGWRVGDPQKLGINCLLLKRAIEYHNNNEFFTKKYGGAIVIIHKGYLIGESYITGEDGGPQPWTKNTCNDMKSSTKSVFGTAVGVFLKEYKDQINLDTLLVGKNREDSLIPQIWDQPISDDRKKKIKVKHVLSMTSGHESSEPWLAPSFRNLYHGYTGSFQMYEYCFGWWYFIDVPAHRVLRFEPGLGFNYSNFGLELLALAMRNISGEQVGHFTYNRILKKIGFPEGIRDNHYREIPYKDHKELNFSHKPGWGIGGDSGCNAYGADRKYSKYGYNTIVGSTFRCTARDFARLGYLWLNKGKWKDYQLVSEEWINRATSRFVRKNGEAPVNYGYTFWVQDSWKNVPIDTFMSRGHNVNHCYVVPSLDLVVVRQGNENNDGEKRSFFTETLIEKIVAAIQ
jgi:CubicO group peptidase (beta-lactamase class C family)